MIFNQKTRTYIGPAKQSESHYGYLDRSGRPEAEQIRNVIEEWVSIYPTKEHPDFLNKLCSKDNKVFLPAFFELYLYALMRKLGANNIDIEPAITGVTTRPDFYVNFPSKERFYLEARCLSEDDDYASQDNTINSISGRIDNKLKGNNIALSMQWDGDPLRTDFSSKILNELIGWYSNLKKDEIQNKPEKAFEFDGWIVKFTAEGVMNGDNRVVHAVMPKSARLVTMDKRLCSALRDKGKKYGKLSEKFIIAVNIVDGTHEHQIHNALFGCEASELDSITRQHRNIGLGNSFWIGKTKWRYTRVSAVIIANRITPWTIFNTDVDQVQIYHHPNPEYDLSSSVLDRLPTYKVKDGGVYRFYQGESARRILKLRSC